MTDAWERIKQILEKSLKSGVFLLWIQPLNGGFDPEKRILTLQAPNEFVASWVCERLHDMISETAQDVLGLDPKIEFTSDTQEALYSPVIAGKETRKHLPVQSSIQNVSKFRYSFQDFVVGPSNELAYVASKSFCREQVSSDQLFLCSSTGLGKTHLVQSMGNSLVQVSNKNNLRIAYLSSEEFACQLIQAIKSRQVEQFKAKYRDQIDLLMLEDIHFFQGKEKIQGEFLSTINALQSQGKKVVLSSSFLPRELKDLDSSIISRLCRGFMAVIDRPDLETRYEIINRKAARHQISIPRNVSHLLAERIQTDIRQLESCINNLALKARFLEEKISMEMAHEVLKNYKQQKQSPGLEDIIKSVCRIYDLPLEKICSRSRKRQHVQARNLAFYLARKYTDNSLQNIGRRFNRRHSTVLKGISNVEREVNNDSPLGRQLMDAASRVVPE
nr:chromosomal replication initiator protein DnaA [Desulfonatronospira sp.]